MSSKTCEKKEDNEQSLLMSQMKLNALCEASEPNMEDIILVVEANREILCPQPLPVAISGDASVPLGIRYFDFPLFKAVNIIRQDEDKDLELIRYLIEEGLKVDSNSTNESSKDEWSRSKGGLLIDIARIKPSPLTLLGLRNKFNILKYLAEREPQLLNHGDRHNLFCKCFYYDNKGAIPHLLEIFPTFLKDDTNLDCRGIERFVAHAAIGFVETFQVVVEAGLQQIPERDRGVITGEMLQILVCRRYFSGLNFLLNHEPPLLKPEDVLKYDLMSFLFAVDKNGRTLSYNDATTNIFELLLTIEPRAIVNPVKYNGQKALPIHIFCEFIMDGIEDDNDFYGLLQKVLMLGARFEVGEKGHGGIFEPFNGTIPAKKLYRYMQRMGEIEQNVSMLQTAILCNDEPLNHDTMEWLRNEMIPYLIAHMNASYFTSRDIHGRLPLHFCICKKLVQFESIQLVVQGNESAITEPDPITGLLPSLLAAAIPPEKQKDETLSIIFCLLRKSPVYPQAM